MEKHNESVQFQTCSRIRPKQFVQKLDLINQVVGEEKALPHPCINKQVMKHQLCKKRSSNLTVAEAQSQLWKVRSLGLNLSSSISAPASFHSALAFHLAFLATQIASSTYQHVETISK